MGVEAAALCITCKLMRMRINTTCYYRECANYTITIAIADFFRDSDNIDTFAQAYYQA